jgi:hypothetical protein
MAEAKDNRSAPREPVHLVATVELKGQEIGCGVSRNASGTGFLLLTRLSLEPGTDIGLQVFVPGETEPRRMQAVVARSERIAPAEGAVWDYRVAVAFRDPPPDLRAILQSLSKRSIPPAAP